MTKHQKLNLEGHVWFVTGGRGGTKPKLRKCRILRSGAKRVTLAAPGWYGQRTFAIDDLRTHQAVRLSASSALMAYLELVEHWASCVREDMDEVNRAFRWVNTSKRSTVRRRILQAEEVRP